MIKRKDAKYKLRKTKNKQYQNSQKENKKEGNAQVEQSQAEYEEVYWYIINNVRDITSDIYKDSKKKAKILRSREVQDQSTYANHQSQIMRKRNQMHKEY